MEDTKKSNVNFERTLNLTILGNGGVGKSSLILQYLYDDFEEEYKPTDIDAYKKQITLQGDDILIDILDSAGQEDYSALNDLILKHGDGFLIVFDLTDKETFYCLGEHRESILRVKGEQIEVPIILVGNKLDLNRSRKISSEEANLLATRWRIPYIETSAKTRENVDKAFSEIFLKIKKIKKHKWDELEKVLENNESSEVPVDANLTAEEIEVVKNHVKEKRIMKFFRNLKKKFKKLFSRKKE